MVYNVILKDMIGNKLLQDRHLFVYENEKVKHDQLDYVKKYFCGKVIRRDELAGKDPPNTLLYYGGDVSSLKDLDRTIYHIILVRELCTNYDSDSNEYDMVGMGEVPVNVHGVGVYFREFFDRNKNYYKNITSEHQFQSLTESNKPGVANRKGIYLTDVVEEKDQIRFKLLRCSTNLNGPTDNFRKTDREVITKVNDISQHFFEEKTDLNHVLAQTYHNYVSDTNKSGGSKAKIKEHSDKTKDMPSNGLMVFCTFYEEYEKGDLRMDNLVKRSNVDPYDYCYKNRTTVLTKLRFRLKECVKDETLTKKFDITLYPNSVFMMPLSMNRLYTHEIIPSALPIDKIPTRMGYVIRCSNTDAIYKNNQTYIVRDDQLIPLEKQTYKGVLELKELYRRENMTTEVVNYDHFNFSLNQGDYTKPIV